jgi:hypothetical protein
MQHHRIIRLVIAFAIGIFLALYSFERISDPEPGMQRAREEAVVLSAREILKTYASPDTEIEIVDPLATDRSVGKAYIRGRFLASVSYVARLERAAGLAVRAR